MIPFFKPGNRTYTLSGVALAAALLLQAHAQEVITLAPMVKVALTFLLTSIAPLVPITIRKAIAVIDRQNRKKRRA